MGRYKIAISERAKKHLAIWKKSGQENAIKRIERIFKELSENPYNTKLKKCSSISIIVHLTGHSTTKSSCEYIRKR